MNATSERYNACLLTLEPGIQARVLSAESRIKRRLASTIADKAAYLEHIPHSVCAKFGQFCGYSLESCQGKLLESFAEYRANEAVAQHDPVCEYYFSRKSIVSMQLWECANGRSSLALCPEAFVSVQERAFATTVARKVEGEHSKTKWATQRGLRRCKPALGCAHQRHVQIGQALQDDRELAYFVGMWHHPIEMWQQLLEHMVPHDEIHNLSYPQRLSMVYKYEESFSKAPLEAAQKEVGQMVKYRKALQTAPVQLITESSNLIIKYFKSALSIQTATFSLPSEMFQMMRTDGYIPENVRSDYLVEAVAPIAFVAAPSPMAHLQFFQVVDAYPERKYQVQSPCVPRTRSMVRVLLATVTRESDAEFNVVQTDQVADLDLLQVCGLRFHSVTDALYVWPFSKHDVAFDVIPRTVPTLPHHVRQPLVLPIGLGDPGEVGDHEVPAGGMGEEAAIVPFEGSPSDVVRFHQRIPLEARSVIEGMLNRRSLAVHGKYEPQIDIDHCHVNTLNWLVSAGVLACQEEFGERTFAIATKCLRLRVSS
eukprot:6077756-Pyramimonas_sp.AAC.1